MSEITKRNLIHCFRQAPPNDQRKLHGIGEASGLPPLPDDNSMV